MIADGPLDADAYALLSQILPVFLLVALLEPLFGPQKGDRRDHPFRADRHALSVYRSALLGLLTVAEFVALLRALDVVGANVLADLLVLLVLALALTLIPLMPLARVYYDLPPSRKWLRRFALVPVTVVPVVLLLLFLAALT